MSIRRISMLAAAAFAVSGAAAIAQSPAPSSPQAPPESPGFTVVGCVQKESAVLKRTAIAGNMGMDDEFVITFAKPAPAPGAEPKPDAAPPEATGTSGSASNFGTVYRLTGDKEKDLKSLVGQRVEISGSLKDKEKTTDAMSSIGTSGKTEPTPSNTAEITIDAIKPLSGACTPAIK